MSTTLRIEVSNPRAVYSPGDTISGNVILSTKTDKAIGQVEVFIFGRAKTKLVQVKGQSERYYRGRVIYFNVGQRLHDDHYTHKPGTFEWPFTATIPQNPQAYSDGNWKPHASFLSNQEDVSVHPLPPTFSTSNRGFGHRFHCYTEYYLHALAKQPAGSSLFAGRSTTKFIHRLRVMIPHPSAIINFNLTTQTKSDSFRTLRLLPQYVDADLTFKEKTKSIFQPSKLPRFAFVLKVTAPQTLQLGHSAPIPFHVSLTPTPEDTSIDQNSLPEVEITFFSLAIKSHTRVRAHGFFEHYDSSSKTIELCKTTLSEIIPHTMIPATSENMTNLLPPSHVDIGKLCSLRLHTGLNITPSFRTYNISHSHSLEYKVVVECAGETVKIETKGENLPITILGPLAGLVGGEDDSFGPPPMEMFDDSDDEVGDEKAKGKEAEALTECRNKSRSAGGETLPEYRP